MRLFLASLLILASASYAQQINPQQVRGTAVVQSPAGDQNVSTLNGVLNAVSFPGSDIGAKVNAAIASLGCGEVIIPAGTYSFSTKIVKPRCISLKGQGGFATILNWTPSSGAAVVVSDTSGNFNYPEGEISDLTINATASLPSTNIGLYIGGDPDGVISPSNGYADHQNFNRIRILGFNYGVQFGGNEWSIAISQSLISSNATGVYFPFGMPQAGESISFVNTRIQNNSTMGVNSPAFAQMYFYGCSFDYNTTGGQISTGFFYGVHFEQHSGVLLTIGFGSTINTVQPTVEIIGGWAQLADQTGTDSSMFVVNSTANLNPKITINGTFILASHPVTNLVNWNGTGSASELTILDLPFYQNISSLINVPCTFAGCTIFDVTSGVRIINGANFSVSAAGDISGKSLSTAGGASIGNTGGFASVTGNGTGLRLDPVNSGSTPIFITNGNINATGSALIIDSLSMNQTPASTTTSSDHSVPIILNGTTYYIRLSSAP